jgi:hypothetical protein
MLFICPNAKFVGTLPVSGDFRMVLVFLGVKYRFDWLSQAREVLTRAGDHGSEKGGATINPSAKARFEQDTNIEL